MVAEELRHQGDLEAQVEVEDVAHLVLVAEPFQAAGVAEELRLRVKEQQELNSVLEVGAEEAKEVLNVDFDLQFRR